ncbi:MAG: protein translocase subunit SecD [Planctomycetota bacterium]|jgi:SecD/SecF fusion protein
MIRAYLGRFSLVIIVAGLLGLAWALKGVGYGRDLAGGAELRYGVSARMSQHFNYLLQVRDDYNDEAKRKVKRSRVEELTRLIEAATDDDDAETDRLKNEKKRLEFELDPERFNKEIEEVREHHDKIVEGAEIIRIRIAPAGVKDIEVRTIGRSELFIGIPYQQRAGETREEAERRFKERLREIQRLVERQGVLHFHIAVDPEEQGIPYEKAEKLAKEGKPQEEQYYYVLLQKDYDEVVKKLKARGIEDPLKEGGYLPWSDPPKTREGGIEKAETRRPLLLNREIAKDDDGNPLDGSIIDRARVVPGDRGPAIAFDLTAAGSGRFEDVTAKHYRKKSRLAIVLDDVCQVAPAIQSPIAHRGEITGDFARQEAEEIARVLTAGSLPVRIERRSVSIVGPSLGRDSIRSGFSAALIGAAAVLVFMLVYYLSGGVVANVGLALNLVIILGALAAFNAKLTLPGIAGLVLTVGMAVDANVLIFERIREEKARGRTLRLAVQTGYDRAFVTIIDANLTTLITAIILYWFGTGPVKGFAVTLTLGILGSLFTSLYASRAIIEYLVAKGWISTFTMLRVVGRTKIPFMRMRPLAYLLSVVIVGGGLTAFYSYRDKYGIDFEGGTMLVVSLEKPMSDEEMGGLAKQAIGEMQDREDKQALADGRSKLDFGDVRVQALSGSLAQKMERSSGKFSLIVRMDVSQVDEYRDILRQKLEGKLHPDTPFPSEESIGQAVSRELGAAAVTAIVFAIILIFLYIVMRFEFNPSFGVGAVVALAHDVAVTAGAMAVVDWLGILPAKIDLPAVAALLTIMGYSLNDTIVVFDRIREAHAAAGHKKPLREVVDEAVNGVLSRSLITSFTTALAAGSLFVFGGDATRGFAFAILVGVIVGTYSSIFVASPIVVEWEAMRAKPRLKKAALVGAGLLVVLALGGLVAQSILTKREFDRREVSRDNVERIGRALREYSTKHEGNFPKDLAGLVAEGYLEASPLGGPDAETGVAYEYVSGIVVGDPPASVLLYDKGLHRHGAHVLFIDGRLEWKDPRQVASLVRATTRKIGAKPDRKIEIVPSKGAGPSR